MPKITLPVVESGYLSTEALNQAFTDIAEAFDNTLSLDGSTPNQMQADLDLNGFTILNTVVNGDENSLVTVGTMQDYVSSVADGIVIQHQEIQTASASQTVFTLTTTTYTPGAYNLAVYVNGVRKFAPTDYTETSSTVVTFTTGRSAGEKIQFVTNEFLGNIAVTAHTHPWSQITNVPVYTTRWPDWAEVTGKPSTFAPSTHTHAAGDITSDRLADARRGVWVQSSTPTANTVGELWFW